MDVTGWRVFIGCVVVGMALFLAWVFSQVEKRNAYEDHCADAGGVAVKSHLGPIVCIDEGSLIEVER